MASDSHSRRRSHSQHHRVVERDAFHDAQHRHRHFNASARAPLDRQRRGPCADTGLIIGCHEAWVLTSPDNEAAKRMYRAAGAIPDEELNVMFTYRMRSLQRDA